MRRKRRVTQKGLRKQGFTKLSAKYIDVKCNGKKVKKKK